MKESLKIITEYLRKSGVFIRERIPTEIKVRAYILSIWGLTDIARELEVTYEAVRKWLIKISLALNQIKAKKTKRRYS